MTGTVMPNWTPKEIQVLERMWMQGLGQEDALQRIAKKLHRSKHAVYRKGQELGLRRRPDGSASLNVAQVAKLLSRASKSVLVWIKCGYFGKLAQPHTVRNYYYIELDDLWAWMEQQNSWHLWEPNKLSDPMWREHFGALRAGWIGCEEAAQILCYTRSWVHRMARSGELPSVLVQRVRWFRIEDIYAAVEQAQVAAGWPVREMSEAR